MVESFGGGITAENIEEGGARFEVILPFGLPIILRGVSFLT